MKINRKPVSGLLAAVLLCALLFSNCSLRPASTASPDASSYAGEAGSDEEAYEPSVELDPNITYYTVTYRYEGEELATEKVPEGTSPASAPTMFGDRGIIAWNNANGLQTDIWAVQINADMMFEAVLGPALLFDGNFMAPESDGLFHPLEKFTRSDAARAVYAILAEKPRGETFLKDVTERALCWDAATSLVTEGYMALDENGRFFPDVAITKADLSALLGKLFSPGMVTPALAGVSDPMTRGEAAVALTALLSMMDAAEQPYYPNVAPDSPYYDAVEMAGAPAEIEWITGSRAEQGFVILDGTLYYVNRDGYFITDDMVGTLYFDLSGRYTSGNAELDRYVSEIIANQTTASMSREEMLRTVYDYVRDHFLYLVRNHYSVGESGWEIQEALTMFSTSKGNCYNFTAAFWALARGIGYDAVCYSGLVGVARDPHSWVEIDFDAVPYIFDVETEMQNRLNNDYYTSMYKMTYERGKLWSYVREVDEPSGDGDTSAL